MTALAVERNAVAASSQSTHSLAVHRCRFVDYTPALISAIAFPPLPLPTAQKSKLKRPTSSSKRRFGTLAVGRSSGNIELYEWSDAEHGPQATQAWVLSKILYGPNPSKVDSLVFALKHPHLHSHEIVPSLSDLRLFSSGGGNELIEWDLVHGTVLQTLNSQGGAIWSMAVNPAGTTLALGCEDGCVRVLDLVGGELSHTRRFDRVKSRLLSIAWGPPIPPERFGKKVSEVNEDGKETDGESSDEDEDEWMDSWLVTGGSDNSLRKWDVKSGRVLERMTVDKVRGERTLVWAVGVLADGTIISGDSLGVVKIWDARTHTQMYSFQAHGADVLCLAISPDGSSIFTSGVDQKICLFMQVKVSNAEMTAKKASRQSPRWVHSTSKRMHSHDVRALAVWPPYIPIQTTASQRLISPSTSPSGPFAGISPILASGGLDASLVLAPCASTSSTGQRIINPLQTSTVSTFEDAYHRRLAYPTGLTLAISVARSARLVACARETGLTIWRVTGRPRSPLVHGFLSSLKDIEANLEAMDVDVDDSKKLDKAPANGDAGIEMAALEAEADDETGYEKLLDMELDSTTNICASVLSDDGRWLAVSDVYEVKLFELAPLSSKSGMRPRRVKSFMDVLAPHFPRSVPAEGASALGFTPDSTRLVIAGALSARIYVVDLTGRTDDADRPAPCVLRRFDHHARRGAVFDVAKGGRVVKTMPASSASRTGINGHVVTNGEQESEQEDESEQDDVDMNDVDEGPRGVFAGHGAEDESDELHALVTHMAFSPDGEWLATTDDRCRTQIFNLDAVQHHTTLPSSPCRVLALAFSSRTSGSASIASRGRLVLLLAHADSTLGVFDVEARCFAPWAAHLTQRATLPKRWTQLHDAVLGAAFEPPPAPSQNANANASAGHGIRSAGGGSGVSHQFNSGFNLSLGSAMDAGHEANGRRAGGEEGQEEEEGRTGGSTAVLLWGSTWLCRVVLDAPVGWGGFMKKKRQWLRRRRRLGEEGSEEAGAEMRRHAKTKKTKHDAKEEDKKPKGTKKGKKEKEKERKWKGKERETSTTTAAAAGLQTSTAQYPSVSGAAANERGAEEDEDPHAVAHGRAQQGQASSASAAATVLVAAATSGMEGIRVAAADADVTGNEDGIIVARRQRQQQQTAEAEAEASADTALSTPPDAELEREREPEAEQDVSAAIAAATDHPSSTGGPPPPPPPPPPQHQQQQHQQQQPATTTETTTPTETNNFQLITRYRPILFADFLSARELLVVERPLVDVLRTLPPAFFKSRYGS